MANSIDLITKTCDALKETLIAKNKEYGNSALTKPRFFKGSESDAILVRLGDKVKRLENQIDAGADCRDTIQDIAGYCVLYLAQTPKTTAKPIKARQVKIKARLVKKPKVEKKECTK